MSTVEDYPKNPDYGHGRYRRRIRLTSEPGQVHGELEDTNHGFRCTIFHDGEKVTDIQSEVLRIPFDTCPGAVEPLRKLIGLALCDDIQTLIPLTDSSSNCTHLLDLALLAIRHSRRSVAELIYDICVEDQAEDNSPAAAEVYANGKLLHRWQTCNWEITGPDELKHKVLYKGFSKWASACFTGEEREAAFILQKGYFVASARRYTLMLKSAKPPMSIVTLCSVFASVTAHRKLRSLHAPPTAPATSAIPQSFFLNFKKLTRNAVFFLPAP